MKTSILAISLLFLAAAAQGQTALKVRVDASRVVHTMAGGAGASWHAMGPENFWYKGLHMRGNRSSRGSGWGGNPPLEYEQAWHDIRQHVRWLGMDFVRVEIDMRMYEPERGRFDWDNSEMRTLYRILDECQQNHVDVFFTQMWQDVEWNAFEAAGRLQSAPKSVPDFVQGISTLMDHLVHKKGYTCIRWLCVNNEPGIPMGWWLGEDGKPASLMPVIGALRKELDRRGLNVKLSGPDWCMMQQNTPDWDLASPDLGAYDAHYYDDNPVPALQKTWAERAHARGLPFFQSEFGTCPASDPCSNPVSPAPAAYGTQLINAEKVLQGINNGVDGFSRWSFVNRGDLDGQWQMLRTWDPKTWDYYRRVTPEPVPYFCYGILTRFLPKHARVLAVENASGDTIATAVLSAKGQLTLWLLNKSESEQELDLAVANLGGAPPLYKYQVTESSVQSGDYRMDPLKSFPTSGAMSDRLPPRSITVYSTSKLNHTDPGITVD